MKFFANLWAALTGAAAKAEREADTLEADIKALVEREIAALRAELTGKVDALGAQVAAIGQKVAATK